jgi:ATP-dependent DNA ligase
VIIGFSELGPGRLEAVTVAELKDGVLVPVGRVQFGLADKRLWQRLDPLRAGPATPSSIVPVRPELVAEIKFFGRYRNRYIHDGVLLAIG